METDARISAKKLKTELRRYCLKDGRDVVVKNITDYGVILTKKKILFSGKIQVNKFKYHHYYFLSENDKKKFSVSYQ